MKTSLFSRVVVPLDGSPAAETILPQLRRFLTRHESRLTVLQTLSLMHRLEEEDAERYVRKMAFQMTNDGYPSKYVLSYGPANDAILSVAAEEQATLIALSTHGRTGIERFVLGSVAEKVLESSPVPLFLVRSVPSSLSRGALEAFPLRRVLLPLDGSLQALGALPPILALAQNRDAQVRLLHVASPTPTPGHWESPDESMKKADEILREACIPTTFEHRRGDPAEEIRKCVAENNMDLIAMTTHGRSGPPRWLLGSVATEVLRHSTVPLLVARRQYPGMTPPLDSDMKKNARQAEFPASSSPPD